MLKEMTVASPSQAAEDKKRYEAEVEEWQKLHENDEESDEGDVEDGEGEEQEGEQVGGCLPSIGFRCVFSTVKRHYPFSFGGVGVFAQEATVGQGVKREAEAQAEMQIPAPRDRKKSKKGDDYMMFAMDEDDEDDEDAQREEHGAEDQVGVLFLDREHCFRPCIPLFGCIY